jgi:hypothetical protein
LLVALDMTLLVVMAEAEVEAQVLLDKAAILTEPLLDMAEMVEMDWLQALLAQALLMLAVVVVDRRE